MASVDTRESDKISVLTSRTSRKKTKVRTDGRVSTYKGDKEASVTRVSHLCWMAVYK